MVSKQEFCTENNNFLKDKSMSQWLLVMISIFLNVSIIVTILYVFSSYQEDLKFNLYDGKLLKEEDLRKPMITNSDLLNWEIL